MSTDPTQRTINQLSIIMVVAEDIAKAAKKAQLHPDMTSVLIKMHTSQQQLEKEFNDQRQLLLTMAKLIDRLVDNNNITMDVINNLTTDNNATPSDMFQSEKE